MPPSLVVTVTCFAASYLVAWLLEITRLFFRSGVRGAAMIAFATAGLVAHTWYLWQQATLGPQPPLSSSFDWCLLTAWVLVAAYLYFMYQFPRAAIGVILLPVVLALIAAATLWADRTPIATEPASRLWGAIHGVFLLLGTVAVTVGFVAGLMYLVQAYRLKHKLPPPSTLRLPSLEWLEKINSRMIHISALMIGVGFISGIILKLVRDRRFDAMPLADPVVWSSALMLAWLVAASIFNAVYKPARQGRKVAYLTLVSFVFLTFTLGVLLLVETEHGGKAEKAKGLGMGAADAAGVLNARTSSLKPQASSLPGGSP